MSSHTDDHKLEPRQRIIEAATRLFARKGYSATSMRELAQEADVNLAMMNYYYGSKQGILEFIMEQFFSGYTNMAKEAFHSEGAIEEKLERFVHMIVMFFKENRDTVRVAMMEFPVDIPEIAEFKATFIRRLIAEIGMVEVLVENGVTIRPDIIGPAIISSIGSHFLLRPVIERVFEQNYDDDFYEQYAKDLSRFIINGLLGRMTLSSEKRTENEVKK